MDSHRPLDTDYTDLLDRDIRQNAGRLQAVFDTLCAGTLFNAQLIDDALISAHTLKALAAVKRWAGMEAHCAQLEQILLHAQKKIQHTASADLSAITARFRTKKRTFESICQQDGEIASSTVKHSESFTHLSDAIERVHQLEKITALQTNTSKRKTKTDNPARVIDAGMLFETFVPWLYESARQQDKTLQVDIELHETIVVRDDQLAPLQTILVHLLRNSLFHGIEPSSERLIHAKPLSGTIQMAAAIVADHQICITVSDDGRGLPDAARLVDNALEADLIFGAEPFEPADCTIGQASVYAATSTHTGLGIGLHIVEVQVNMLGGTFELKSIPQVGTSAIIHLPNAILQPIQTGKAEAGP